MPKLLLLFAGFFFTGLLSAQNPNYWQQEVNNVIHVTLDDSTKTLDGRIIIDYVNNSPDTLRYIWFHCWPNAYKNDYTAFSDQLLENGRTDFYFAEENKRGYINRLNFTVDQLPATTEDHPQHQDIIKLLLPKSIAPKQSVKIETPFHIQLPYYFSRSGYIDGAFHITQWYPKPAVYDRKGWHEMPYLDQGEFYSEFGKFDVHITTPAAYIVAATGNEISVTANEKSKTWHFNQDRIHDFAWFADKQYKILEDTVLINNRSIKLFAYFRENKNNYAWSKSLEHLKSSLQSKSTWLGEYPYDVMKLVALPGKLNQGGMEYPTITLLSTVSGANTTNDMDHLINHETGHNWFYGILASNERVHPWMDEGMNSYYDNRYANEIMRKPDESVNSIFFSNRVPTLRETESLALQFLIKLKKDQPINTVSEKFSWANYGTIPYKKAALWMNKLEMEMGRPLFDSMMQLYYKSWQFKHPYPEDFREVAEEVSGRNLDAVFNLLDKRGFIDSPPKSSLKFSSFFNFRHTDKYRYVFAMPAIGYNHYDKFMAGVMFHNYTLPPSALQFFAAPMYATGSKTFNGMGRLSYRVYPGKKDQHAVISIDASRFSNDVFIDSTNKKNFLNFSRIVPSVKFVFANKNPRSLEKKWIQWRTFLVNETGLRFSRDTVQQIDVITYPKISRYLNQLQLVWENRRVLYPYQAVFQAEQADGFIRLNFTGNYFLNYAKGGGLQVRFFAGKFIYTTEKTFVSQFRTDRFHLNMSGPEGYEDYNYRDYFVGRNEFEGFADRQLMIRDGAFKVKTDLLSSKVGKTDDWLTALNLTTSIPDAVNPLSLLPIKIPIRLFFDVGTYAEAWDKDASTGRFLYDAGFQVSLLKNTVNVYFPLLYSKVYKDYFKSVIGEKIFSKNISFSINLQQDFIHKLFPQIAL